MRNVGFSTGAIALEDFQQALNQLEAYDTRAIELSALRLSELGPLLAALPNLDLSRYSYISLHLPSSFSADEEAELVGSFNEIPRDWALILHPDSIHDHRLWRSLASRVVLENMDRRKKIGRTAEELKTCFELLPDARLCFDIGHARQFDPSMAEAYMILTSFPDRLAQVHVSEVDAQSRHGIITYAAGLAFKEIAHLIPQKTPLILESRVSLEEIASELTKVAAMFKCLPRQRDYLATH